MKYPSHHPYLVDWAIALLRLGLCMNVLLKMSNSLAFMVEWSEASVNFNEIVISLE